MSKSRSLSPTPDGMRSYTVSVGRPVHVERPSLYPVGQIFTLDEFHDDVRLPVLGLRYLVDRADVRMINRSGRLRLADEPSQRLFGRRLVGQYRAVASTRIRGT